MSEFIIKINKREIVRLPTAGKYCPEDIFIVGAGDGRNIVEGVLTAAEKTVLSKLTWRVIDYPSTHLRSTLPEFYAPVGISVDMKEKTHEGVRTQLFKTVGGVLVPREATDDTMRYFQKMQVAVQGGSQFAEDARVTLASAVANNVLQVGDVIAGYHNITYTWNAIVQNVSKPFTALYQGDGKFLIVYSEYVYMPPYDGKTFAVRKETLYASQIDAFSFAYYYTLRPENLATE